jgi:hypothetical protein
VPFHLSCERYIHGGSVLNFRCVGVATGYLVRDGSTCWKSVRVWRSFRRLCGCSLRVKTSSWHCVALYFGCGFRIGGHIDNLNARYKTESQRRGNWHKLARDLLYATKDWPKIMNLLGLFHCLLRILRIGEKSTQSFERSDILSVNFRCMYQNCTFLWSSLGRVQRIRVDACVISNPFPSECSNVANKMSKIKIDYGLT